MSFRVVQKSGEAPMKRAIGLEGWNLAGCNVVIYLAVCILTLAIGGSDTLLIG